MMLMCKLMDEKNPVLQASAKEIVALHEEKVCLQDHGSESRVDATDAGGDSKNYINATGVSANFAKVVAASVACAQAWRTILCATRHSMSQETDNQEGLKAAARD
jgi:hypothetical protein